MIEAVIFDMDGVLVDSEPCWIAAEIEIFAQVGVALTPALCEQTTGLRIDAVVRYWYERFAWKNVTRAEVTVKIAERVAENIRNAQALPGRKAIISAAKERNIPVALCSSSPYCVISEVVHSLGLHDLCVVYSAEEEPYGKPHPGAYMTTADKLGVAYDRCLVFEDSMNGAISGKAAGMRVIAVPQGDAYTSTKFDFCDAKLASLTEFDPAYLDDVSSGVSPNIGSSKT